MFSLNDSVTIFTINMKQIYNVNILDVDEVRLKEKGIKLQCSADIKTGLFL